MSYKASIRVYGDPKYYDNAVRFATRKEADDYGKDLSWRWTQAEAYKVSKSTDPVNYRMVGGEAKRIEGNPAGYPTYSRKFGKEEYRFSARGSRATMEHEAAEFVKAGWKVKLLEGTGRNKGRVALYVKGITENPTIGQWARRLYVMKGKKFAAHVVSQGPRLTKLQLITHKGTLSRPITIENSRLAKEFYVARDNPGGYPTYSRKFGKDEYIFYEAGNEATIEKAAVMILNQGYKVKVVQGKGRNADRFSLFYNREPQANPSSGYTPCRCCGKPVPVWLDAPIHTKCIPKHWMKHAHGINASRCHEFGKRR